MTKPKIEFISLVSGVDKTMPIIEASKHKPSWIKRAAEDFKSKGSITQQVRGGEQMYADPNSQKFNPGETRHTSKCPALQQFHNTGYIMRLHTDIKIDVSPDVTMYQSSIPGGNPETKELITSHMEQSMYPFFENWPKGTMKQVLKFNLPWVARIPKGYKLLQMHPMYLDDNRFTTCSGILEPHLGHAAIGTVPFFCHFTGIETIKAGTPIAQFVLIPDEDNEMKVIDFEDDKNYIKERSMNYLQLQQSFNKNYNKIREFWKSYGW
jgi:hypothetical protein